MKLVRRILVVIVTVAVVVALYQAMQPQPVQVDLEAVTRGPLRVTIEEDGRTRIKERYVVSAPLAGRLLRIHMDPGDPVDARQTAVAVIEPNDPQLLNPRELATAEARERAAEATVRRSEPLVEAARADLSFAESELGRQRELMRSKATSITALQAAERLYRTSSEAFRSATFAAEIAKFEWEQAQSALVPSRAAEQAPKDWRFDVFAPIQGKVLRVLQESAAVVSPGTPLLEVGDPADLELEIDVLSSDAVKIEAGNEVVVQHWGGDRPLQGVVRLVEPSAFTKISALGVEEQRVNVIIDLLQPFEERSTLGDGFRVEVQIVVWEGEGVLQVPTSAIFRDGDQWHVFQLDGDTVRRQKVELGKRNVDFAEVLKGVDEGTKVVVHPSDQVEEGVPIVARE